MWHEFAIALSLIFVIEGILPFLSPTLYRSLMQQLSQLENRAIRIGGLVAMLSGLSLLYLVR